MGTKIINIAIALGVALCVLSFLYAQATEKLTDFTSCVDRQIVAASTGPGQVSCSTGTVDTVAWTPVEPAAAEMLTSAK